MGFNATPDQIRTFSDKMNQKHADIQGMITRAEGHANDVNNPSFQGEAGRAFQTSMQEYLSNAKRLNDALDQAADTVGQIAGKITDAEVDNAAQIMKNSESSVPQLNMTTTT